MGFLTCQNLCRDYGQGKTRVRALDNVSLSVEQGEFVSIIGSSGSGKSTLMHLLGGVDRPTGGLVTLQGQDIFAQSDEGLAVFRRREVGLIYQFYNLIPILTVRENITLPVTLDGRVPNRQRLQHLIETLGLTGREDYLPHQLSGGQQQRVAIGRALINAPALVLADEPTGNLDTKNSKQVMELLRQSNKENDQTLVIITHDEDIALMSDRIISIEDGRVVSDVRTR